MAAGCDSDHSKIDPRAPETELGKVEIHGSSMPASTRFVSFSLRRPALASLAVLGCSLAAACSSSDAPSTSTGGAGPTGTAGSGPSGGVAGAMGVAGSGLAGSVSAGASQGGSATGGGGSTGTAGSGAGSGGAAIGGGAGSNAAGAAGAASMAFALTSTAFKEGEEIPLEYKCMNVNPKGQNVSPPLSWGPGPAGTKSYAIVLMHVPSPEHWVLWDIPATVTSLPKNIEHVAQPALPAGSKQSLANLDGFSGSGYLGPCPQAANSRQSYKFTVYALDVEQVPGLSATSTPTAAATAVKAHLVAGSQGVSLTGTQIQTP